MEKEHNYRKEINQMMKTGALPITSGVSQVNVYHDDWCMVFSGGKCNCEPKVTNRPPNRAERRANKKK